jgi:transposase
MYLRRINKCKSGKSHYYWALVESYRTDRGVRQRVVGYIGDVSKHRARGVREAVERCESYQQDFLSPEELPDRVEVQPGKTRTERQREFGGVWLGNKLFRQMGLESYFADYFASQREWADWASIIKVLVLCRFFRPSSELMVAEHVYEHSALEDLLGIASSQVYENRLYRALDKLLPCKESLQGHLKRRMETLFGVEYDLFLYDVTSTYFEGEMNESVLSQRGYSRDSRPDCKQVCIALVVTKEGLPLGYEVFAGNRPDSTTVVEIVEKMEALYGIADRIWVMDRGMVSERNLAFLRRSGRRYIIGTARRELRRFEQRLLDRDWCEVRGGVEVKLCNSPDTEEEQFILCKSKDRARKEQAIHDRFARRIEEGIDALQRTCEQRRGKDISKAIERRVGRLLERNSRAAAFFEIRTSFNTPLRRTLVNVQRHDSRSHWLRRTEGHYLLRTNISDWEPQRLWEAYITLTDAEEAFRIHKSDLHLRPIWHRKDDRIQAHIFVCFLAFALWKSFALMCKQAGLGDEPRRVFEEIKKISIVDVVLITTGGEELRIRTVPKPAKPLQVLLHRLGLRLPERLTKRIL